jgi:transcriptional regulator with XRE-family HTH domain
MTSMNITERRTLADHVAPRRIALGWTQSQLAERAGVSLGTVGNTESGAVVPQKQKLLALTNALEAGEQEQRALVADMDALTRSAGAPELRLLAEVVDLRIKQEPSLARGYIDVLVDVTDRSRIDEAMRRVIALGVTVDDESGEVISGAVVNAREGDVDR